jgi:hypothetical protein
MKHAKADETVHMNRRITITKTGAQVSTECTYRITIKIAQTM